MLCHQHPADSAHAACQRCQRGLCRSCSTQFLQRLCTHCIEQSASKRTREARRTLWLALPVFTLAAWGAAVALPGVAPRPRLFVALLAGMVALGTWFGLRRWRRAPALAGGIASLPESETPALERVLKPALAGIVFWPWLLIETLRDMQLANRLRAFVPEENRQGSFGFGEASLAFASVAAAFTLGVHGLRSYTPVAGKLWSSEASLAASAEDAVRGKLVQLEPGEPVPVGTVAPHAETERAPADAPAEQPAAQAVAAEPPASEASSSAPPPLPEPAADPEAEPAQAEARPRSRRERHKRGEDAREVQAPANGPTAATPDERDPEDVQVSSATASEPGPAAPPPAPVLDRRYVPGSEMAKQVLSGSRAPDGSYVTSSGRVVIKAPPPTPK